MSNGSDLSATSRANRWHEMAERVLAGQQLDADEAVAILRSADEELLDLLAAVFRVRRHYFGVKVQLYFLVNAKSGVECRDFTVRVLQEQ